MHLFSECLIEHRLIILIHFLDNITSFLFHVCQILADKLMKNCPYYRVNWIGINKQGCTWEPKEHLQGEKNQTILRLYLEKKQAELVVAEKKKQDRLASSLIETDMAESSASVEDTTYGNVGDDKSVKVEDLRHRVNESPSRHHFGK